MKIERFEDIIGWQKAKVLTVEIYRLFGTNKDFGFKDQIQRASVSIWFKKLESSSKRC